MAAWPPGRLGWDAGWAIRDQSPWEEALGYLHSVAVPFSEASWRLECGLSETVCVSSVGLS